MDSAIQALNDPVIVEFFKSTIPNCSSDADPLNLKNRTRETSLKRRGLDTSYPSGTQKQLCPMKVPVINDDESLDVNEEYRRGEKVKIRVFADESTKFGQAI